MSVSFIFLPTALSARYTSESVRVASAEFCRTAVRIYAHMPHKQPHAAHPHQSWRRSFKLNSETPFSILLFARSLPPLPCQHHVRPGRSMWQAAGITLTFSAPCSSASLSQTSQSTVNHLGQRHSEPRPQSQTLHREKQKFYSTWHRKKLLCV